MSTPGCLDGGEAHRFVDVTFELELVLDDGRHVRLAGVEFPRDDGWPEHVRAMLAGWLAGRTVLVRDLTAEPDRWDRWPALVFADEAVTGENSRVSVTEALIEAGLARVKPEVATASCQPVVLDLERRARTARHGLWADPAYAVIAADDEPHLTANTGRTAIVEGRILDIVAGRSRSYLRMTPAGRHGLAISVERRVAAEIKAAGIDMTAWRGRAVRIRGLVENRSGLIIDLTSVDQIEFTGER